ncbi:hypothetical protein C1H46_007414 [Malus baccata]|uniref:Uncharacterized protein n=1 Tax=Malus baccata TaxID=106549 RepID=A0A540N7I8_MALBA|nr:hypothetical protein C1H46_007414 [Malus baccata]
MPGLGGSNLGSELTSGVLTLNSAAKLNGRVEPWKKKSIISAKYRRYYRFFGVPKFF